MQTSRDTPTSDDLFGLNQALTAYCAGIDAKDYDLFRTAFASEIQASYGEQVGEFSGVDQLAVFMERLHRDLDFSLHRLSNFRVVEFDGSMAETESYLDALLVRSGSSEGDTYRSQGIYTNRFRRQFDGWRISVKEFRLLSESGNPRIFAFDEARALIDATA